MNKRRWNATLIASLCLFAQAVEATTITDCFGQLVTVEEKYINTSHYHLTYKNIRGFLVSPLQTPGDLLSPFNQAREGYTHEGIDIRAEIGTPIFAVADGVVTKAAPDSKGIDNGGGNMIFLDIGNGVEVRYMHLEAYGVQYGEVVKAGQVIGFTGNTGDSTTPHLHFEYRIDDKPIDPAFIFEASGMIKGEDSELVKDTAIYTNSLEKNSFYVIQE